MVIRFCVVAASTVDIHHWNAPPNPAQTAMAQMTMIEVRKSLVPLIYFLILVWRVSYQRKKMTGASSFLDIITVLNMSLATTQPHWVVEYRDRWAQPGVMNACINCDTTVWRYHDMARMFDKSSEALQFINQELRDGSAFDRLPRLYVSVAVPMEHAVVGYDEVFEAIHVPKRVPRKDWVLHVAVGGSINESDPPVMPQ